VYLYFPISGGWRTQELTASAKYLSPVAQLFIELPLSPRTPAAAGWA
jgi:hypothetical protein